MNFKYTDLNKKRLPGHVAVIMDGNGRWANKRLFSRVKGHEKGVEAVRMIVKSCRKAGIPYLTLYAFSTENWNRPQSEIKALMNMLKKFLESEFQEMADKNIRLNAIGQTERLFDDVRNVLENVISVTKKNSGLNLNLGLSYGSRSEITKAVRSIAKKVKNGIINVNDISESIISQHLYTKNIPDPDLIIRTSGEMRLSNFLLWQAAYTELYFTNTLWPDFAEKEFIDILQKYQNRNRRFGGI